MNEPREVWSLLVRDEPADHAAPFDVRVRKWIKAGLSGYGVRLVSASATTLPEQVNRLTEELVKARHQLEQAERRLARAARRESA